MTHPQIQAAFDVVTVSRALKTLEVISAEVDVIEAGTVLCLSEGLGAVTTLRKAYPNHRIVADIRIARAGKKFADMAFRAGADRVTVTAESPHDVVEGAAVSAIEHDGGVEVELGPGWKWDDVRRWRDLGVANLIVHRPARADDSSDSDTQHTLDQLAGLDKGSMAVTLAGGLGADNLAQFGSWPVDLVVVGSSVVSAPVPLTSLRAIRRTLDDAFASEQS